VQLVPILAQPAEAVRRYIEDTGLPFDILVDESRDVVKAYAVWHRIGLDAWNIARPAVFLIDQAGHVRYSFVADSQREYPAPGEILAAVDEMRATDDPDRPPRA
jgi:methyl-accepting chemotaxis protein